MTTEKTHKQKPHLKMFSSKTADQIPVNLYNKRYDDMGNEWYRTKIDFIIIVVAIATVSEKLKKYLKRF